MSIAINQLPTLLTSTIIFLFIILLIMMSIKMMRTYRNKQLHILFIIGLSFAGIQQLLLLFYFQRDLLIAPYIISTAMGMLSFIIINYALIRLSIANGKVKTLPYIIFGVLIVITSVLSYLLEPVHAFSGHNSYGLPILDLTYIVIIIILLSQIKILHTTSYHYVALSMMLINMLSHLFHHYLIGEYTLWLHITEVAAYVIYFLFIFMVLFVIVTEKMRHTYLSSIQDHMTGLYLRQVFLKKIARLFEIKPIAIIFCDIDNFKQLNDTKGHLVADQILIEVANIIKHETIDYGFSGRYGGEEMVAGIDISYIKPDAVAEQIRKRIAEETEVTVSIGISTSKDSADLHTLLKYADEAMYYSKSTGKNKVSSFKSLPASYKNK